MTGVLNPNFPKDVLRARRNYAKLLESTGFRCDIYRQDPDAEGLSTGPEAATLMYANVPFAMTYTPLGSMGEPMNNTTRRRTEISIPGGTSRMSFAHPDAGGPVILFKDWFRTSTTTYIAGVVHTNEDPAQIDQEVEVEIRRIPRRPPSP